MVRAPLEQSYFDMTLVGLICRNSLPPLAQHSSGIPCCLRKRIQLSRPALSSWRSCTQHRGMHSSTVAPDPVCNALYDIGVIRIRTSFKTILPEDERIAAAVWSTYRKEAAGGCFRSGTTAVHRS